MSTKKSPNANLEDKKLTFTLIGLVFALSLIFVCFEWTDKEINIYEDDSVVEIVEEEMVEQTFQEETPPPPPPKVEVPDIIEEIVIVEDDVETEELDFSSDDDETTEQEIVAAPVIIEEEEEVEEIFMVVEQRPEFPGGTAALMKYFSNNVRYPVIAMENGIQGRVICQFTIWKDGSVSDVVVVRPVDPSLDREAIRLIQNMPKWQPGKQRGKAVNCKFTVPVNFMLR